MNPLKGTEKEGICAQCGGTNCEVCDCVDCSDFDEDACFDGHCVALDWMESAVGTEKRKKEGW